MTIWLAITGNSGKKFGNDTKIQQEFSRKRILFECQHCYVLVIGEDAVKVFWYVCLEQRSEGTKDVLTKFDEYYESCTQVITNDIISKWSWFDPWCCYNNRNYWSIRWIQGCFWRLGGPPRRVSHRHRRCRVTIWYIHLAMYQWLYKTRSKRNCMRW